MSHWPALGNNRKIWAHPWFWDQTQQREVQPHRESSWEPTKYHVPFRGLARAAQTNSFTCLPVSLPSAFSKCSIKVQFLGKRWFAVIPGSSWAAISDPVLLHGPRRRGRTSVWLRAYLRNCATLAIKAPAPGCSTFPECKDTIPVNWLHSPHRHWRDVQCFPTTTAQYCPAPNQSPTSNRTGMKT